MAEAELTELIGVILDEKSGDGAVQKVEQLLKKRPELAKMQRKEGCWLPLHTAAAVDGIDVRIVELLLKAYPQATMQSLLHEKPVDLVETQMVETAVRTLEKSVAEFEDLIGLVDKRLLLLEKEIEQLKVELDNSNISSFSPGLRLELLGLKPRINSKEKEKQMKEKEREALKRKLDKERTQLNTARRYKADKQAGTTPLSLAAKHQGGFAGAAVCKLLLQYGPQAVMEKDKNGWLPLHIAACYQGGAKGTAIVELLLKAAPQACMEKINDGHTPLRIAAYFQGGDKGTAVVEALLRAAPQAINIKDNDGKTPLDLALDRVKEKLAITTQLSASDPLIAMLKADTATPPSPPKPPAPTPITTTTPKPAPVAPAAPIIQYDIFISLRFGEAMDEAVALKAALQQRGLSVFLCDVPEGKDIARTVISALTYCKLAVILGTLTYGTETTAGFSTFDELRYIKNEKKPFFLVKMCERFEVEEARVRLPIDISYFPWQPKSAADIPPTLVERILKRHAEVAGGGGGSGGDGGSGTASGSASPTKLAGAHNPTSAAAASAAGGEDELKPDFVVWLAALDLGSDLPKVLQVFLSLGILSKDKLSLAVRKSHVSVERLAAQGVRVVSAEAVLDALERN